MNLRINGELRPFETVHTVSELIEALGYAGRRIAIERNGEIVPRSQHATTTLADGDALEIVVAVGGG